MSLSFSHGEGPISQSVPAWVRVPSWAISMTRAQAIASSTRTTRSYMGGQHNDPVESYRNCDIASSWLDLRLLATLARVEARVPLLS